jgi:hypothetical protein
MADEFDFERLEPGRVVRVPRGRKAVIAPGIVDEPAPVIVPPMKQGIDWIAVGTVVLALAGTLVGVTNMAPATPPTVEVWPPDGPSVVFGVTMAPEPPPCPVCPEYGFLARFVEYLDRESDIPREIRDVMVRSYTESRYTPTVVSVTGDWCICGINAESYPEIDHERLLTDPEYAGQWCLAIYRAKRAACGDDWQCCYLHGVAGCRGRSA